MKIFKLIWNEFIYGGHIQSLGAVGVVIISSRLLNLSIDWSILVVIYLIFYILYLYNRIKEVDIDYTTNPERTEHIKNNIKMVPIVFFLAMGVLFSIIIFYTNIETLIVTILILILGYLYTFYFKKITKSVYFFKNIYVSLFFSIMVFFPLIYYNYSLNDNLIKVALVFCLFVFLKSFLIQIFLDIKDLVSDKKQFLKTMPTLIGKNKTIRFLFLSDFFITVFIPLFFVLVVSILPRYFLFVILVLPIKFYCYNLIKRDNYYAYILQGSEYIIWTILIFLGSLIL